MGDMNGVKGLEICYRCVFLLLQKPDIWKRCAETLSPTVDVIALCFNTLVQTVWQFYSQTSAPIASIKQIFQNNFRFYFLHEQKESRLASETRQ